MKDTLTDNIEIPTFANFVQQGTGTPVVMIHGIAASLHDWDDLIPALSKNGYASYALDLLGHGDSPKLNSRAYRMEWLYEQYRGYVPVHLVFLSPVSLNSHPTAILLD